MELENKKESIVNESDEETEDKSVVHLDEVITLDDEDSDDTRISKYFEDYDQHKQINEMIKLNQTSKKVYPQLVSITKIWMTTMIQMMKKSPRARDSVSILETIGGSKKDKNDSSSGSDTLQQISFKNIEQLNTSIVYSQYSVVV